MPTINPDNFDYTELLDAIDAVRSAMSRSFCWQCGTFGVHQVQVNEFVPYMVCRACNQIMTIPGFLEREREKERR